jgi:tetratricopeptide (TPR) repeat protein
MFPAFSGRRALILGFIALAAVALASPAPAQTTGILKGMVIDAKGQPLDSVNITIEFKEGISRTYKVKTNKRGEFIQIGLTPGQYKVTAEKEKLAQSFDARVRLGETTEVKFKLAPGEGGTTASKEAAEKGAKIKGLFDEGVTASKAGDHDGAIAKFSEALTLLPECYDCLYNIGYAYTQKKEYDKAEEAYKKSIELKADYADAYNGLATVYNAEKKFAEAKEASNKAAELQNAAAAAAPGGVAPANVDVLYNQGVIAWNAGEAENAQKKFQEVLKINPNHADAHFQLAMTLVNQGKLAEATAEFEAYLKLAPEGQYAAQAKAIVAQLKK